MPVVEIYTKRWCPYCARAKALLKIKGVRFEETEVDGDQALFAAMVDRSHRRTVPQVFIGRHHVGGSDELQRAEEQGLLDRLLGIAPCSAA